MPVTFNILTDSPTLVYPNGGEIFTEGSIDIQWTEPGGISSDELVWYEIFITDNFDKDRESEKIQIGTIPSGNSSYSYYIDKNLKSDKCRIGVRAVNHEGLRSKISFSAGDFTITNKRLPSPSLLEPTPNTTYFSHVPIIFNHEAILGRCSQRAFYQIYYKSDKQDIDWTLARGNIMIGSEPFDLDVSDFSTSSDYALKIELVDDTNVSQPTFIEDITINNINYFVIDTVPPKGFIKVKDNEEYINNTNVVLGLDTYDKTTAVKDFQIDQVNVGSTEEATPSPFSDITPLSTWDIQGEDGVKLIQARYRDYGNNIVSNTDSLNYFRTYKSLSNEEVTAFLHNGDDLYIAFDGSSPALYKNLMLLFTLGGEATSIEYYNNTLYIAIKDSDNKGILQRISGGEIESAVDNEDQYLDRNQLLLNSLYLSDSVINAMEVFDEKLFLGLHNGKLLSFNGSTISDEYVVYLNSRSIKEITTDGNLLYLFFTNTTDVVVMNVETTGDYAFTTIDTES